MNTQWVQSYVMVVETGSISKAAKALFISPQALLQQINLLESEIGIKLLERTNQGSRPTAAGDEFYRGAAEITEDFSRLLTRCRRFEEKETPIRIPFMSSVIAPRFIEHACAQYSKQEGALPIDLVPTSERTNTWINGLLSNRYDIIQHFTIDGIVPEGIHFEMFGTVPTWCIVRPNSDLAELDTLIPTDLTGKVIAVQALALTRYFQLYLESSGIEARMIEIESDRYSLLRACDNDCVAFVDEAIAHEFPDYHIAPLDFDNHVQQGLACREEQYALFEPFFEAARSTSATFEDDAS